MANRVSKDASVLSKDLIVLRRIDMEALDYKTGESPEEESSLELIGKTNLNPDYKERDMPWFLSGYVANDHPRDSMLNEEIVANTFDFAVARPDTGEILASGLTLAKAESAVKGAKVRLSVDIEIDADEEPPAEFDPSEAVQVAE